LALFERFHLSQEEAEARLERALSGDPTRGEIGLLAALAAKKLEDVQGRLARDATLGADLRELVGEHLQNARARWGLVGPGRSRCPFRSGTNTPGSPG
jgi:hypothetical protein